MAVDERFGVVDYVVFSVILLLSVLIGIWYGCGPGGKQNTTAEYLLGDRQMKSWPIAISLLVSFLSAISLLGLPGEIYTYGTQFYVVILSYVLVCAATSTVYIPMFRRIRITSVNEVRKYAGFVAINRLRGEDASPFCSIWEKVHSSGNANPTNIPPGQSEYNNARF